MRKLNVQERLEASRTGRGLISVFLAVTVVSLVVWNLPESELKRDAVKVVRPYVMAVGLNQNWGVFAPDPRRHTLELVANVRYSDGTEKTLSLPRGGRLVGGYWDYRWRKWAERATADAHEELWEPTAAWFARRAATDGRRPVRVTLVRRWQENPPPGFVRGEQHEYAYFTYEVPDTEEVAG